MCLFTSLSPPTLSLQQYNNAVVLFPWKGGGLGGGGVLWHCSLSHTLSSYLQMEFSFVLIFILQMCFKGCCLQNYIICINFCSYRSDSSSFYTPHNKSPSYKSILISFAVQCECGGLISQKFHISEASTQHTCTPQSHPIRQKDKTTNLWGSIHIWTGRRCR